MKKKAIIWDLDGTLTNTLQDLSEAVNHAMVLNGFPVRTLQEVRSFVGNGVRRLMELAVPDGEKNPGFDKAFDDFKAYYAVHCQDHTCLYEGVAEVLRTLKERGFRMAVVSNKLQSGVDALYEKWFGDTIEIAIGERQGVARKPAPDMVFMAIEELGISKDDAVYIGDSEVDLATAQNAGLECISVLWGFRERDFLLAKGAVTLVEHPREIAALLED